MWTFSPINCTISAFKTTNCTEAGIIYHLSNAFSLSDPQIAAVDII
jgi:hypothetical protein